MGKTCSTSQTGEVVLFLQSYSVPLSTKISQKKFEGPHLKGGVVTWEANIIYEEKKENNLHNSFVRVHWC